MLFLTPLLNLSSSGALRLLLHLISAQLSGFHYPLFNFLPIVSRSMRLWGRCEWDGGRSGSSPVLSGICSDAGRETAPHRSRSGPQVALASCPSADRGTSPLSSFRRVHVCPFPPAAWGAQLVPFHPAFSVPFSFVLRFCSPLCPLLLRFPDLSSSHYLSTPFRLVVFLQPCLFSPSFS